MPTVTNDLGQIRKGEHLSPATEFKAGLTPWNKGKDHLKKEAHPNWKGGKPNCLDCGKQLSAYFGKRCSPCHLKSSAHKQNLAAARKNLEGKPHPFQGRHHSEDSKKAISKKKTGVSAIWNIGKGHEPWNKIGDGITPHNKLERAKFRRVVQPKVLARDNYTCQICDEYGGYLHVDHIKSWAQFPELRFNEDNCRTLCRACHYYITFRRKLPLTSNWGIVNMTKKEG